MLLFLHDCLCNCSATWVFYWSYRFPKTLRLNEKGAPLTTGCGKSYCCTAPQQSRISPGQPGKLRSGRDRSQQGRIAPDLVPQQPDGKIRAEILILLKCMHHVQGNPSQDAHHCGGVAPVQAAVVRAERYVQGTASGRALVPAAPQHPQADWQ